MVEERKPLRSTEKLLFLFVLQIHLLVAGRQRERKREGGGQSTLTAEGGGASMLVENGTNNFCVVEVGSVLEGSIVAMVEGSMGSSPLPLARSLWSASQIV